MRNKPDFICLTEHWLKEDESGQVNIPNYKLISNFSRVDFQHGGTSIYVKTECDTVSEVTFLRQKSVELSLECSCVQDNKAKLLIICIYRSQNGNLQVFLDRLSEILDIVITRFRGYNTVICGDFNIDLFIENTESKTFLDLLAAYNFHHNIFQATRVTETSATLLDNIFTDFIIPTESQVLHTALSDHYGQFATVPLSEAKTTQYSRKYCIKVFT